MTKGERHGAPWPTRSTAREKPFFAQIERDADSPGSLNSILMKKHLGLGAVLALLSIASRAAENPNILLILADDLGYGDVRCYNAESKVPTPNLDRLASEGMRFTDAHSPSTVCTPTRYGVMTGQMPFRVPRGGMVFTGIGGPSLIAPGRLTLPPPPASGTSGSRFAIPPAIRSRRPTRKA
jgi:hypothetical protein